MRLLLGLGNPGKRYESHRHNIGAQIVDSIAVKNQLKYKERRRFGSLIADNSPNFLITKSLNYMNESGVGLRSLLNFYKLDPTSLIVFYDDLDLQVGDLRLKKGGGSGGHNGIKSIEQNLGTNDFCRVRVGIGRPTTQQSVSSFVLSEPSRIERERFHEIIAKILGSLVDILEDFALAMNDINQRKRSN